MDTRTHLVTLATLAFCAGTLLADEGLHEAEGGGSQFDRVIPAGSMIGRDLESKRHTLGVVSDYVVDIRTGYVVLILVVDSDPVQRTALPVSAVSFDGTDWHLKDAVTQKQLAAARRVAGGSAAHSFRRNTVRELLAAFGGQPPWKPGDQRYDPQDQLPLWRHVRERQVYDRFDALAGDIEDIGISPHSGRIVYAAVDVGQSGTARRSLHPVPLTALVIPDVDKDWKIELSQVDLMQMQSFSDDQWPLTVERAWVEYVRVRYGESELAGAQTEPQADAE